MEGNFTGEKEISKDRENEILTSLHSFVSTIKNNPAYSFDLSSQIKHKFNIPRPKDIKDYLDQYIIGQEEAKRTLAVAVHNHYVRINSDNEDNVEIQKSNILLVGDSGSGKTLLAQTIAKYLNVPFVMVDATALTPVGIVGKDIEDIAKDLLNMAHNDKSLAEKGIVYIDEIDKISSSNMIESPENAKGVLCEGTQSALLKLLEGTEINLSNGRNMFGESNQDKLDTKNILFICGGAFSGIREYVKKNDNRKEIGFLSNVKYIDEIQAEDLMDSVGTEEIIKYGMMPEVVGRLPVLIKLKALNKEDLRKILTEPKNAIIKQYQKLLDIDGVALEFADDALDLIADMAIQKKVGARGLRGIVENIITDIIFELPDDKFKRRCVVTAECIVNKAIPQLSKTLTEGNV